MKQLRIFETQAEYDSATLPLPNVCLVNKTLYYNKKIPFYVEAIEDLNVSYVGEYSRDRRKWTAFDSNSVSVQAGERLYLRYTPTTYSSSSGTSRVYINDGKCNVGGNVMSLLYGSNYGDKTTLPFKNYDLAYLFKEQTNIVSAKDLKLPVVDLTGCNYCYSGMFQGCKNLIETPTLPAMKLGDYCYEYMFRDCINLTTAPTLPATTLALVCYHEMFHGCKALISVPELPAMSLTSSCYNHMFYGCTSLTTTPVLPATTLAYACYESMFEGCTSLTTAPVLPATTLASYCYFYMFYGCTSLINAPELPAKTLGINCYNSMFRNCTSLTTAPTLPAKTLVDYCYANMFGNCYRLNYIRMLATNISTYACLGSWVSDVSNNGTFVKHPNMNDLPTGRDGIPKGWEVIDDESVNYLTIEALEDGLTVSLSNNACEYSSDLGVTWQQLNADSNTQSINTGDKLLFRGELIPNETYGIGKFTVSKKFNLSGNCMSMLFGDGADNVNSLDGYDYAFRLLFQSTPVVSVSDGFLPATTLCSNCYRAMFAGCVELISPCVLPSLEMSFECYRDMYWGCTSLTVAPELPATTLADSCYKGMFNSCSNLLKSPKLSVLTLTTRCYDRMFKLCSSLQEITMLATDISAVECLDYWVESVPSGGTFYKNAAATWNDTEYHSRIPSGWTVELVEV